MDIVKPIIVKNSWKTHALNQPTPEWKIRRKIRAGQQSHLKRLKLKQLVTHKYGGRCDWCHTTDIRVLCIDHIENDGAEHRRELGFKGAGTYKWLKAHGYPSGFQVLCANCNWLKELELRKERDMSTKRSTVAGRDSKERSRLAALTHYSRGTMRCAECSEPNTDVLTFYNPNDSDRKASGERIVNYLKNNNYPEGYTVVCMNCSMRHRIK